MIDINMIANIIGIVGVILILVAYYFLNTNRFTAKNLTYQLLNLIGSALVLFSLFFNWNLPAVVIEIAWIVVSLIGIYRALAKE